MKKIISLLVFFLLFSLPVFAAEKRYDVPLGNSPQQLGPRDAVITIIEFLDFQ